MSLLGDWCRFFFKDWLDFWCFTLAVLTLLAWGFGLIGCVAPGAVDVLTRTDLDAVAEAIITMDADIKAVGVDLSEKVEETSNVTQKSVLAISNIDQSTSDDWVNRGLVIGLVTIAVLVVVFLAYPIGKKRWLRNGREDTPELPSSRSIP